MLQAEGEGVGEAVVAVNTSALGERKCMTDDILQILGVLLPESRTRGVFNHAYGCEAVAAVGTGRGLCDTKPDVW